MLEKLRSDKTLIVGSGSGRDIASSVMVRELLRKKCPQADLAGFLTPWAFHSFNNDLEKPVNFLLNNPKKYILSKNPRYLESFFEPLMEEFVKKFELNINDIHLFSLQYGTKILFSEIQELVNKKKYDTIIVVDVGGDILAAEADMKTIMTPLVDLTCMDIMTKMPSDIEIFLAVIAPGVCGEIGSRRLKSIFKNVEEHNFFITNVSYNKNSKEYIKYKYINEEINKKTNSYSHTEKIVNEILEKNCTQNFKSTYKKTYWIANKKFEVSFPVEISKDFFNTIYFLNLRQFKTLRMNIKMEYSSVLDGFLKMRALDPCGTEVDLSYVPFEIKENNVKQSLFLLTPCCKSNKKLRKQLIEYGYQLLDKNEIQYAIILTRDKESIPVGMNLHACDIAKRYTLLSKGILKSEMIQKFESMDIANMDMAKEN